MYHCTKLAKNRKSQNKRIINFRFTLILSGCCPVLCTGVCNSLFPDFSAQNGFTPKSQQIACIISMLSAISIILRHPVYELHQTRPRRLRFFYCRSKKTTYYNRKSTSFSVLICFDLVLTGIDIKSHQYFGYFLSNSSLKHNLMVYDERSIVEFVYATGKPFATKCVFMRRTLK